MELSALQIASRFLGIQEVAGPVANPMVLGMLRLDTSWVEDDATAWCSAFVNYVAFLMGLPRSKSLAARSWLLVGNPVGLETAAAGFDVVVLKRGKGKQPGPDVLSAPGHVGFYAGVHADKAQVLVLGGNQGNAVSIAPFPITNILSVRRLLA